MNSRPTSRSVSITVQFFFVLSPTDLDSWCGCCLLVGVGAKPRDVIRFDTIVVPVLAGRRMVTLIDQSLRWHDDRVTATISERRPDAIASTEIWRASFSGLLMNIFSENSLLLFFFFLSIFSVIIRTTHDIPPRRHSPHNRR